MTGMTPERWKRVKEVFTAASELAGAERSACLAETCGDDRELRAEVESLLNAHAAEHAIVDRPAAAHIAADLVPLTDPWIGRRIGPYETTALIGRGGMGDVYRARRVDAEYEKEVAIKLVPGGFHANHVLQQFRAERQILANLDHPHIARLIDGGATDEGTPYLAMELVDGMPIDRYATERRLSIRERLRLFADVCAAVSYAHQRLVVHRDLKPGNILVTTDGSVKLLDFGIAKLLQPSTETGPTPTVTLMRALTPGYASPEQLLGKTITTASDVYSLGVVLYLLLTGRSPYRSALETAEDAIREVCETEPPRASAIAGESGRAGGEAISRDLDAIIMQALRKEPERRYASVDLLSEDIRRYLSGMPVVARGDQLGYRMGKFLRRHKFEAAAAALLVLTLIGATAISLREARIATEQRERAERHFASVRQLADVFMFQVHDAIKELPGSTEARKLLVDTALEYLNTLAAEAGDDHSLRQELASAYEKVADIQGQAYGTANKGEPQAALESYAKSIALLEPIVAADPANRVARGSLARNLLRQSRLLLLLGDEEKAPAASERAVAMFEELARADPDAATRGSLADAYSAHAYTSDMTGGQEDAGIAYARKAIDILEDLTRQNPEDLDLAYKLATAYSSHAITLLGKDARPETLEASLEFHRKALQTDERLVAATEGRNMRYARALLLDRFNVAFVLNEQGDYRGAVESARAAQPVLAILRGDASNTQVRVDAANLAWPLGRALLALGETAEAKAVFEHSLAELEQIARESDTLKVQYLLGTMAFGLGEVQSRLALAAPDRTARLARWRESQAWYRKAIPHFERVTASVTLDHMDIRPVNEAAAGLARSTGEIRSLTAPAPAG